MRDALFDLLRCPGCKAAFVLDPTCPVERNGMAEVQSGCILCRGCGSHAPIRSGIPRLLELTARGRVPVDKQTQKSFSFEWALHRPEDGTWGMTLDERTTSYFLNGVSLRAEDVPGLRVLDAGCGNGSSSLGIARLGATCVGIDQSTGLEKAREYFTSQDARCDVHYVQANLMDAPFAPASFDIVFSAGVLHHTPDTKRAFMALAPLVKPGGRFYMWLYRHERGVTPVVNALRSVTVHMPPAVFFGVALAMSPAFQVFTRTANLMGLREYRPMTWRASALALLDIFGARYAHAHTFEEVSEWYVEAGFDRVRLCSMERRGFSVCGQKAESAAKAS